MIYSIIYSTSSLEDLLAIYEYIGLELYNEKAATKLIEKIKKSISLLSITPYMHKIIDDYPWNKKNLRIYTVKNYSITYIVDEETKTVKIVRIIYSKMDLSIALKNDSGIKDDK